MISSLKILKAVSVFSFIDDDFRLVWFIIGFVAGADLGMIFAAIMYAAGKEKR